MHVFMVSITYRFKTPREKCAKGISHHVTKGNMQSTKKLGMLCMKHQRTFFSVPIPIYLTNSILYAWRIPGTGEPGGLLSMGSHRVGHG